MAEAALLLKNGIVLLPSAASGSSAVAIKADILVSESFITQIRENIPPTPLTRVIDCSNKIVSPGFVDTHRHLWQTQLKGRHANELLEEYMVTGNLASSLYTPSDVYWGQLAGILESLDAGTTTIVDHSHNTYSPANIDCAVAACFHSKARIIYCPAAHDRVQSWEPFTMAPLVPEWFDEKLDQLATRMLGD